MIFGRLKFCELFTHHLELDALKEIATRKRGIQKGLLFNLALGSSLGYPLITDLKKRLFLATC